VRFTALFFVIAATAIGGIYLYVVPQLRSRLEREKITALTADAQRYGDRLGGAVGSDLSTPTLVARVRRAAVRGAVRVTLLRVGDSGGRFVTDEIADSAGARSNDLQFPIALEAAGTGRLATGTESGPSGRWAEVARPARRDGRVVAVTVFSTPLNDVQRNVAVVRHRILVAGAVALAVAVLAGAILASVLTARIKRLERAAEAVAAGDFSRRITIDSDDELGQLARAFDDMQSQLAQLDTARKRFIATASHELRTPLFSLSGFVELLEDEDLDEEDRERFLVQIREQVERLRKLSVDLLDLSRLEAGSLVLRPEPVDVAELVRSVMAEFEPAMARRGGRMKLRLPEGPAEAVCDPVRVAQVLRVLIDNALTHTPPGTDVVVAAENAPRGVRLQVRDRGPGIAEDELDRIFEPFHTSDGAAGSGLGLAIASELAERMDGRLAVDSRPGRTTFTLEVPA